MLLTIKQFEEQLKDVMRLVNPSAVVEGDAQLSCTVWAEGGEWAEFKDDYLKYRVSSNRRDLDVPYINPGKVTGVEKVIGDALEVDSVCALSLDCNAGKSTALIVALHSMKLAKRTLVLEPSSVNAMLLSGYMNTIGNDTTYYQAPDKLSAERSIVYMSVGSFLHAALTNQVSDSDVVVLDESHCVTPTHVVAKALLATMTCSLVMMTASTSTSMRGVRGARLIPVARMTPDVSAAIAKARTKGVAVGVLDNGEYASSANSLIGATLDLTMLYDSGLRPDPRLEDGKVVQGERVATQIEIHQMVGRVNRTGTGGEAYYVEKPVAMRAEGLALYDVMLTVMSSVAGLPGSTMSREVAAKAWRKNGRVGRSVPPVVVPEIDRSDKPANVIKVRVRERTDADEPSPRSSVSSEAAVSDKPPSYEDKRGTGSYARTLLEQSKARRLSQESSPEAVPLVAVTRRVSSPVEMPRSSSDERRSSSDDHTHWKVRRNSRDRVTSFSSEVKLADGSVVPLRASPTWRPFRMSQAYDGELSTSSGILSLVKSISRAVNRGDMIYPPKFPRAARSETTNASREDARRVLANILLPSYSELEMLSATVLWNDTVDTLKGAMPRQTLYMYIDYFEGYVRFVKNRSSAFEDDE